MSKLLPLYSRLAKVIEGSKLLPDMMWGGREDITHLASFRQAKHCSTCSNVIRCISDQIQTQRGLLLEDEDQLMVTLEYVDTDKFYVVQETPIIRSPQSSGAEFEEQRHHLLCKVDPEWIDSVGFRNGLPFATIIMKN